MKPVEDRPSAQITLVHPECPAMLSLLLDDDAEGAGLVGFSLYKHGAKVLRGTQNAAYQSVILLIFKKFQPLTTINVENRKKTQIYAVLNA